MHERLAILLTELGRSPLHTLTQLHGHASYRTYYRARLRDGSSLVVMAMPPGTASVSEEITNFQGTMQELPFVNVARNLAAVELPVPHIIHYSAADHWLLLEDLGDQLLADVVTATDETARRTWYQQAIDLLVAMQTKTPHLRTEQCIALQRSFDAHLLNWEFDHFREYGIEARLNQAAPEPFRKAFTQQTRALTEQLLELPYCFVHRDFQSRNLIIRNDMLYLLDFQDALRGPYVYDLVALLRDSYVELPIELVEELVVYYAARAERDPRQTRTAFHRVTVQRKLKDAGRFACIDRVKGNPDFLPFIPASLQYVKSALARIPEGEALFELLRPYVPEWK